MSSPDTTARLIQRNQFWLSRNHALAVLLITDDHGKGVELGMNVLNPVTLDQAMAIADGLEEHARHLRANLASQLG